MLIKLSDNIKPTNSLKYPYKGVVVSNIDPKMIGRVKVSIKGLIEGDEKLLPWVFPWNPSMLGGSPNSTSFAVPRVGSEIVVEFPYDDIYSGFYTGYWRSDSTDIGIFKEDYPSSYGYQDDSNNSVKVNRYKGYAELTHQSGSKVRIDADGSITLASKKAVSFSSIDGRTKVSFDLENGTIDLGPKGNLNLGGASTSVNTKDHSVVVDSYKQQVSGAKETTVLGGASESVGGSKVESIFGNHSKVLAGEESKTVAMKSSNTYGLGVEEDVILGNYATTIVAGNRNVDILLGNYNVSVTAGNISISTLLGSTKMKNLLGKVEIDTIGNITISNPMAKLEMGITGDIKLKNTVGGGLHINPMGMVALGSMTAELLALFDQLLTWAQSHIHGTGVGPSSPPITAPQVTAIQALLTTIKGSL